MLKQGVLDLKHVKNSLCLSPSPHHSWERNQPSALTVLPPAALAERLGTLLNTYKVVSWGWLSGLPGKTELPSMSWAVEPC